MCKISLQDESDINDKEQNQLSLKWHLFFFKYVGYIGNI